LSGYYYSAYGQRLYSELELPELRPISRGSARWTFRVVSDLKDRPELELLGAEPIYGSVEARLYRHAEGHRITVHDTGVYDLLNDCTSILWQPNLDPWWDFGRAHLVGRVLATCMQLAGIMTLHGSAVALDGQVVGFLAPKHSGKSTLARMLQEAGASFVTDDALPITMGSPIQALPGIHSLRVVPNDGQSIELADGTVVQPGRDGKIVMPPMSEDRVLLSPAPLAAIYLLRPVPADAGTAAATRVKLAGIDAAIRLVSQCKIGAMLGASFAGELLRSAAAIAMNVPVYELSIVRDLNRLPEATELLLDWHSQDFDVQVAAGRSG